ncbi:hypothetical protein AGR56_09645 [Clostridium sp. DMHC 10]|uniref:WD40 repeat domain-containing protein n=1 Tax=Clostridium sp. DMHC 10 TaxID=747377 RepID=UPI00069D7A47|nr:Ig-like domain-containing protein [Clostridium sp. DMHC 10]KOF56883.1 hypothetical protein AGR56_09645 [Clostridium sp. DMHC 10]
MKKINNLLVCIFVLLAAAVIAPNTAFAEENKPITLEPYATTSEVDSTYSAKFSPDGSLLAEGGYGKLTLWDSKTTEKLMDLKFSDKTINDRYFEINKIIFTPDSSKIFTLDGTKIRLIDIKSSKILYTLNINEYCENTNTLDAEISNDGKTLYCVNCDYFNHNYKLSFYDVDTGNKLKEIDLSDKPTSIAYNKNNNTIAVCLNNGIINIRNSITCEQIKNINIKDFDEEYNGYGQYADETYYTIEFSQDGKKLICINSSTNLGEYSYDKKIFMFDVDNNYNNIQTNSYQISEGDCAHSSYKISNDDKMLYIDGVIYDADSMKPIAELSETNRTYEPEPSTATADFNKDNNILAVGPYLYDLSSIPHKKLASIKINASKTTLNYGEKSDISLTGYYDDGTSEQIQYNDANWSTSDLNVAIISDGNVISRNSGKATISVEYEGLKDNLDITVLPQDNTDYKVLDTKYDQPVDKVLDVNFSTKIDISTVKEKNIYVTDSQNNILPMFYYCNQGSENRISIIPVKDYVSGQAYTLWIKDIKSADGKTLSQNVKMNFTIK